MVPLFRVLALQFPFAALGKAHEYRLRRTLQFRTLFGPTLAGGLTKGVVSIVLAVAGAGAWSLVIGQVAGTLAQSLGMWLVHSFRPDLVISRRHLPSMMRFGLGIVAVGLLGQGAKNFDYLVVGGKLRTTRPRRRGCRCPGTSSIVGTQTSASVACQSSSERQRGRASTASGSSHSEYCGLHTLFSSRNAGHQQERQLRHPRAHRRGQRQPADARGQQSTSSTATDALSTVGVCPAASGPSRKPVAGERAAAMFQSESGSAGRLSLSGEEPGPVLRRQRRRPARSPPAQASAAADAPSAARRAAARPAGTAANSAPSTSTG